MLDPLLLRKDLDAVVQRLATRGVVFERETFEALEAERKQIQTETEQLQAQRNALAKQIGGLKGRGEDASALMAQSQAIPVALKALEEKLQQIQSDLSAILMATPNLPHASVPLGADEQGNIEVSRWVPVADAHGNPAALPFEAQDHVTVGERLGLDFETATKLSGSRFSFLRGPMARLHRALAQFMLDLQTSEHGYTECYTPYIVNASTLLGTGQLPKFREDMFWVGRGGQTDEGSEEQF